jgi:hypothetical protein
LRCCWSAHDLCRSSGAGKPQTADASHSRSDALPSGQAGRGWVQSPWGAGCMCPGEPHPWPWAVPLPTPSPYPGAGIPAPCPARLRNRRGRLQGDHRPAPEAIRHAFVHHWRHRNPHPALPASQRAARTRSGHTRATRPALPPRLDQSDQWIQFKINSEPPTKLTRTHSSASSPNLSELWGMMIS